MAHIELWNFRGTAIHKKGLMAIVDDDIADSTAKLGIKWCLTADGQVRIKTKRGRFARGNTLQRFVLGKSTQFHRLIKFKNRNKLDCRRQNLSLT